MYKNALVVGKFYPFHSGHKYLIDTAIENSEKVHVIACYTNKKSIDGIKRFESIRYEYSKNPNVKVYPLDTSDLPQYDTDCRTKDEFYDIWCYQVWELIKDLDVVFTSAEYGEEFADYLGTDHYMVDLQRKKYPTSGTKQRDKSDYTLLPNSSKNLTTKKYCFVGPESSGKSTISKMVADELGLPWVEEYGRRYIDEIELTKKTRQGDFSLMDISKIAAGQILLEEEIIKKSQGKIICDTDLITTMIWSEIYFDECPRWIVDESYRRDYIYFLMDIDFEWIDDGTREFPEKREWHFDRIKAELQKRNLEFYIVSGDINSRFNYCKDIILKNLEIV